MRVEQGVKIYSNKNKSYPINEHCIYEQMPDRQGYINYWHIRNGGVFIATCDKLETAIKIAKLLNEDQEA